MSQDCGTRQLTGTPRRPRFIPTSSVSCGPAESPAYDVANHLAGCPAGHPASQAASRLEIHAADGGENRSRGSVGGGVLSPLRNRPANRSQTRPENHCDSLPRTDLANHAANRPPNRSQSDPQGDSHSDLNCHWLQDLAVVAPIDRVSLIGIMRIRATHSKSADPRRLDT